MRPIPNPHYRVPFFHINQLSKNKMENQTTLSIAQDALTIVELEERFELTAAAIDTNKCDDNDIKVEAKVQR
jgi:hypothetical protein